MAKLVSTINVVVKKINDGAVLGLADAAEHLLTESGKTIPLDEGTMARDGQVDVDAASLSASVYYDGPSNPYVKRQHEELGYRHAPGRRAKWLEETSIEEADEINRLIADAIRRAHG